MEQIKISEFKVREETAKWLRTYKKFDSLWSEILSIMNELYEPDGEMNRSQYELFKKIEEDIFKQVNSSIVEVTGFLDCPKDVV
ncbi:MAG: hypothetical protein IKN86_12330 [Bacteroidaceae bacterium]|jgi:hypothetical protein|nr:hypothetical protein [Bacteroidaceae bacterium]